MLSPGTSLRRLRTFVLGRYSQNDLDEELSYHVDLLIMDNIEAGMSPDQARLQALKRFGDVKTIKRRCRVVHRGSLPGAMVWLMGLLVVCGVLLWASPFSSQTNVLGQLLVINVLLFRLLMYLRALPAVVGSPPLHSSELNLFQINGTNKGPESVPLSVSQFSLFARKQMLRIVALFAVIVCCLCAGIVASSAMSLSNRLKQAQETDKFVGTWELTVGDVYDRKDLSSSPAFSQLQQGLPRHLPLVHVIIELQNGKLTGKRVFYFYSPSANSQSPDVRKGGELNLVNIIAQGNVLTGNGARANGEQMPGGWELKLTGDTDAEVTITGDDVSEEQKKLVLKLHRQAKQP